MGARGVVGGVGRHLAVLRPAPVRGRLLAAQGEWSYAEAALRGSSYLKLPKLLQFFTGNIGLHHVHHLNPRIPNYNLQRAHDAKSDLRRRPDGLDLGRSSGVRFKLWDEEPANS